MTRKLLPYEHDLIAALGITKEEYLEFVAIQQQYNDVKEGTVLDIRNDAGIIVAIVLAVVGTVFQVVSALLMPRPEIPDISAPGQAQTREQRFSPRFGFNSAQQLAKYGDTVPVVYTDRTTNPNGGVRIAGALLWSAVRSFGSNQFLQMLMLLAGGAIRAIDPNKSAFGQTPVTNLITQNKWIYFEPNSTGRLTFADETSGNSASDPTRYGSVNDNPYRLQPSTDNTRVDGFSQAYSPSTSNIFGGYSPVPLNVETYLRDDTGTKYGTPLGIYASGPSGWSAGPLNAIPVGATMQVSINSTATGPTGSTFQDDLIQSAIDARRGIASVFDDAGIFKLGSAKFRVSSIIGSSTDEGNLTINLTCIEAGRAPSMAYTYGQATDAVNSYVDRPDYIEAQATVNALLQLDERDSVGPSFTAVKQQPSITIFGRNAQSTDTVSLTLPSDQRYSVLTAEDLLASGQIWQKVTETKQTPLGTRLSNLPVFLGGTSTTETKYVFLRNITANERAAIQSTLNIKSSAEKGSDTYYFLKAIVRTEEASYNTVTSCSIVDIALKTQVYRRISGRQQSYGSSQLKGYAASDNGFQQRTSIFTFRYRVSGGTWTYAPGLFAVRRAADQDNFVYLKFNGGTAVQNWEFKLEPVVDPVSEVSGNPALRLSNGAVRYFYLQNSGNATTVALGSGYTLYFTGFSRDTAAGAAPLPPINESPVGTNEWDWFSLDGDTQLQNSFDRGPEFAITAVSEQQRESFTSQLYNNLALIGFNVFSGKSLQDMRSFTAFVTQGKPVRRLNTSNLTYPSSPDGATCFAPDIFLDTVIDDVDGIGNYAELGGIDTTQLAITKRFCRANNLFMDGLIADRQSWREFWAMAAPFSLLEFARIGGRETLIPAVPYNPTTGAIDRKISITALFNQGNILADSYKEEFMDYDANVQDIIAVVIYRALDANGIFAVNKSVSVQRRDTNENDAIRQTFDLSAYVTNESQAILFAKLLCNIRRYVRSAVEFKTYPTTSPVSPGAYIYVDVGFNAWDSIRTGTVGPNGVLNIPLDSSVPNGNYNVLLYRSGNDVISTTAAITNNTAPSLAAREGWLFVLGTAVKSKRVYRISDVQMDEEGQVTVRATIFPCDTNDNSLIADFSDSLFTIRR